MWIGVAHADKKKRVVVLEFEGKHADKFHESVEMLVGKHHEVVPVDKWNETATNIAADGKLPERIRKIAKKLHVDAVITGKVEKKDGKYTIKLKLRDGKTGDVVGSPLEVTDDDTKLDKAAKKEIRESIIVGIDGLGGKEVVAEADPPPKKHDLVKDHPETGADAVGDKTAKVDPPPEDPPKHHKKKKVTDATDPAPEPTGGDVTAKPEAKVAGDSISPGERAVDVALGMSFVARRLNFTSTLSPGLAPPGYSQTVPVPGALIDATIYPLAFGHSKTDITKNIGINVLFDQVIHINSQLKNIDQSTTKLQTTEGNYAFGGVIRFPFGSAMTITGMARYGRQSFSIAHPTGVNVDLPSTAYSMVEGEGKIQYVFSPQITIDARLGVLVVLNAGNIADPDQYGKATGFGFETEIGADYLLTKSVFARASVRAETLGLSFNGSGTKTYMRDNDPTTIDVTAARDTYFGATLAVGYLY
ncbi:MAG TPA: hypothetical protein VGO00_12430 [Kofleriaceae bacterium]|jgi:hypothetical protein|nr:hypothetical protein [Kofleriaceae bacterium]